MIEVRRSAERGHANRGWLDTCHTFSFGDYYDPAHMGFSVLRVINEDRVQPGAGFGTHGHKDMEIISYVLDGVLAHKDSLGNEHTLRPGDVQRLSAGFGIQHSEFNKSSTEPVHFLQIWITPAQKGLAPGYQQRHYDDQALRGRLQLVASPDGRDGSLLVHQDAFVFVARLSSGAAVQHQLAPSRKAYLHVARGGIALNGAALRAGDGAAITEEREIRLSPQDAGEVLLFDLP